MGAGRAAPVRVTLASTPYSVLAVMVASPVPTMSTQPLDTTAIPSSLLRQVSVSASTSLPFSSATAICVPLPSVTSVLPAVSVSSFGPSHTWTAAVAVRPLGAVMVTRVSPGVAGVTLPVASTAAICSFSQAKESAPLKFSGTTV